MKGTPRHALGAMSPGFQTMDRENGLETRLVPDRAKIDRFAGHERSPSMWASAFLASIF